MRLLSLDSVRISCLFFLIWLPPVHAQEQLVPCRNLGVSRECVTTEFASEEIEKKERQLMPPSKGMSKFYLIRSGTVGAKKITNVNFDDHQLGSLVPNSFLTFEVKPGVHELNTRTFTKANTTWEFKAGEIYFFRLSLEIFFNQKYERIETIGNEAAIEILSSTHLIKTISN